MKNIRDSYILYRKTADEPVNINIYIKLAALYLKFLLNKVYENYEVTLPARMGTLQIIGTKEKVQFDSEGKVKGLAPNWKKTKELWDKCSECKDKKQLIYNTNEHSDGIRYKFFWSKKRVLVTNKTLYSLRLIREAKREIYNRVINGQEFITN